MFTENVWLMVASCQNSTPFISSFYYKTLQGAHKDIRKFTICDSCLQLLWLTYMGTA